MHPRPIMKRTRGMRYATIMLLFGAILTTQPDISRAEDPITVSRYPRMVTPETVKAIRAGVHYLKSMQRSDGSWTAGAGAGYPTAMTSLACLALAAAGSTPTRGPQAAAVRKGVLYLLKHQNPRGLISGPGEQRSMYGHGFALLFLGTIYGGCADRRLQKQIKKCLDKAVQLTVKAQSDKGGWYYGPDSRSDEGSVTVTQMQGLRAARNAGIYVPDPVIKKAVNYLKICQMGDGGICYSARNRGTSRPAITAAAVACMYSAGAYDSPIALKMIAYLKAKFGENPYKGQFFFYTNFYWTQVMYIKGQKSWTQFYPKMRQSVLTTSFRQGNHWNGSGWGTGPVYGTSLAVVILAMPYRNLPIFHR